MRKHDLFCSPSFPFPLLWDKNASEGKRTKLGEKKGGRGGEPFLIGNFQGRKAKAKKTKNRKKENKKGRRRRRQERKRERWIKEEEKKTTYAKEERLPLSARAETLPVSRVGRLGVDGRDGRRDFTERAWGSHLFGQVDLLADRAGELGVRQDGADEAWMEGGLERE